MGAVARRGNVLIFAALIGQLHEVVEAETDYENNSGCSDGRQLEQLKESLHLVSLRLESLH